MEKPRCLTMPSIEDRCWETCHKAQSMESINHLLVTCTVEITVKLLRIKFPLMWLLHHMNKL